MIYCHRDFKSEIRDHDVAATTDAQYYVLLVITNDILYHIFFIFTLQNKTTNRNKSLSSL